MPVVQIFFLTLSIKCQYKVFLYALDIILWTAQSHELKYTIIIEALFKEVRWRKQIWSRGKPFCARVCKTWPQPWQAWDHLKDILLTRIMKMPFTQVFPSHIQAHWKQALSFNNTHWRVSPVCKAIHPALQTKDEKDTVSDHKTWSIRIHWHKSNQVKGKVRYLF